jgi:hypothetical protein
MPRACQEFVFGERNEEERKRKVTEFIVYRVGFTKKNLSNEFSGK